MKWSAGNIQLFFTLVNKSECYLRMSKVDHAWVQISIVKSSTWEHDEWNGTLSLGINGNICSIHSEYWNVKLQ